MTTQHNEGTPRLADHTTEMTDDEWETERERLYQAVAKAIHDAARFHYTSNADELAEKVFGLVEERMFL